MARQQPEDLAFRVSHYHKKVSVFNQFETVSHFVEEEISKSTLYNTLWMYDERKSVKFETSPGRPKVKATEKVRKDILHPFPNSPDTSERAAVASVGISQPFLY